MNIEEFLIRLGETKSKPWEICHKHFQQGAIRYYLYDGDLPIDVHCPISAVAGESEAFVSWVTYGRQLGLTKEDCFAIKRAADNQRATPDFSGALRDRLLEAVGLKESE